MEFRIGIADVCALIRLDDDEFANQLIEEHYNNFLSNKDPSLLEGSQVAIEHYIKGDSLYFKGLKGDIEGCVNLSSCKVTGTTIRVPFRFDALLRVIYSLWLVKFGGLMVHAAGVKDHDGAYVFCGVSGSGKTTIARLSEDKVILGDELIAIRSFNGLYKAYGTPFMGEFVSGGVNIKTDLRHIFLLKKDQRNFLVSLD
ncbi:MAG: hypothetical protein QMC83_09560 [Thermodesulfovibrionales bacterium]|nr:hypothetical protein [Thermodesulfovibrionales bacterium]